MATTEREWLEGGSERDWLEGRTRTCACPALEIGLHGHRRACPLSRPDGVDPDVVPVRAQPVVETDEKDLTDGDDS